MQDSASFWSEIKTLEEALEAAPGSYCFARLSEVYLSVGLIDDALHVARRGTARYPAYISGQRSLAQACHARGLDDEARAALQIVTAGTPEDTDSLKLLGTLLMGAGDVPGAVTAFRTALEFAPGDVECRMELESLAVSSSLSSVDSDDDDIIEDLELFEEAELCEDDETEPEESSVSAGDELIDTPSDVSAPDPLSTGTLAELYVSQGFISKALDIYRAILADNPEDRSVLQRIAELDVQVNGVSESGQIPEMDGAESFESEEADYSDGVFSQPQELFVSHDGDLESDIDDTHVQIDVVAPVVPMNGAADNAVRELEGWLANIGRIKACR